MKRKNVSFLVLLSCLALVGCTTNVSSSSPATSSSSPATSTSTSTSSSVKATYTVTSATGIANGALKFDKASYRKDDTVIIDVLPTDGYYLASITLDDADTVLNTFTEGTRYYFTMPAKNVVVNATFDNVYKVNSVNKINWGTGTSSYISKLTLADGTTEVSSATTFRAGESVTLNLYGGANYSWQNGFYYTNTKSFFLNVNDDVYQAALPANFDSANTKNTDHFIFSFTMPSSDVDLYVTYNNYIYEDDTSGHKITVETTGGVKAFGYNPNAKYSGATLYVLREDSTLVNVQYQYAGATEWSDLGLSFETTANSYFVDNISYTKYLYLTGDVTIRFTGTAVTEKNITYTNADKVTFTSNEGVALAKALPGDRVNIGFTVKDKTDVLKPITITGIDEDKLITNKIGSVSFDMPNADIAITFNVVAGSAVTFKDNEDVLQVKGVRRYLSDDFTAYPTVENGKEFYLFLSDISLDTGKLITGAKLNGGETASITSSYSGNYFTFTMPESGTAEITIITANSYTITVNKVTGGYAYISSSSSGYAAGTIISGSYYADNMYEFDKLSILKADDTDVTSLITDLVVGDGNFQFTMPDYSIQITPSWKKQASWGIIVDLGTNASKFASDGYNRSYIQGDTSYNSQYFPATVSETAASFKPGETVSMTLNINDSTVIPTAVINDGTTTTKYSADSYSSYNGIYTFGFSKFYKMNSNINLSFELVAKTALKATINNPNNIALAFKVNGETATDLSNVKYGDQVAVSTTASAGEGKVYGFEFLNSAGKALTANYDGTYTILSDFTLNVLTFESTTVTINSANNYTVQIMNNKTYDYLESGASIMEGTSVTITAYDSQNSATLHVKVTNGSATAFDDDYQNFSNSLVVKGALVVTVTAA